MNNKHQKLIDGKVAELKQNHCHSHIDPLKNKHFFLKSASAHNTKLLFADIEKTLQDTIDTVLKEERSSIKIDSNDMQKVGDHYWGGDYEPTYYELEKLTESMNEILQTKLKALDKTPPNTV